MKRHDIYEKYNLPINCKIVNHKYYPNKGFVDIWYEFNDYRYYRCISHKEFITLKNRRTTYV